MRILISDPISDEGIDYLRQQPGFEIVYDSDLGPDALLSEICEAKALILRSRTQVTAEVIKRAKALRVIGRAGTGVDNIDVEAATTKGVVVMNTPGGNSVSAAEHAFALLMTLARKIPSAHASIKAGKWDRKSFIGHELQNKTLGIVGLGKIGAIVAQRAQSFGMKVIAFDPFVSEKYTADLGVELMALKELFSQCDFVSLHLPLNKKTTGLICKETLSWMKKGCFLVNTSRGALVVEEDLASALEADRLAGAALDVFEKEPVVHPALQASNRAILTPHIAGWTVEAHSKVGYDIAVQVANYLQNEVILNAVNFPSMSIRELEQIQPYLSLGEKLGAFLGQISRIRVSEIGLRYYGDASHVNYKPISNYILKAILRPILSEEINEVNAKNYARERGILVVETVSSRERSHSNLISIQLRSLQGREWIEGAILRHGNLRLVSIDGIPVESNLGEHILLIRNNDKPGVIGQVGTILGDAQINIASFVLGRDDNLSYAVGIVNTDTSIPEQVLQRIRSISAVQFAQVVHL